MSFVDWDHQFCLGCDKQTDGAYCSEACRLGDYEKTSPSSLSSTPSSGASSPALSGPNFEWTFSKPSTTSNKFYLSHPTLSPSASHTSLCSMRSTSSAGLDSRHLSEKSVKELRAYANSFESVRNQRRRSH
ncbi:hypothetical protein QBC35DRAFT_93711 [Podospora australis]|uniref:Life-span regulatory factor domain-containing protein n=1 Tax=Podospora australis TaxID=1536484 RepID=A0AAN6WXD4_9PEZI|nr:hypothetical protein QBC35DRAFT_93711 [Podospora australis]